MFSLIYFLVLKYKTTLPAKKQSSSESRTNFQLFCELAVVGFFIMFLYIFGENLGKARLNNVYMLFNLSTVHP